MNTSTLLRTSLVASALATALTANAISIFVASHGTYSTAGTIQTMSEVVDTQVGGYDPLSSLSLQLDLSTSSGVGTYTGALGTFNFDFSLPNAPTVIGNSLSYVGVWSTPGALPSGTGGYTNKTGSGTLSVTIIPATGSGFSATGLSGDLQAVPEPASMAALAVGGLGLLRRRRKA